MEYHSVYSAPDSRMEGMRFTRNRLSRHYFVIFFAENPTQPLWLPVEKIEIAIQIAGFPSYPSSSLNSFILAKKLVVMANTFWPCSAAVFADTQVHAQI